MEVGGNRTWLGVGVCRRALKWRWRVPSRATNACPTNNQQRAPRCRWPFTAHGSRSARLLASGQAPLLLSAVI